MRLIQADLELGSQTSTDTPGLELNNENKRLVLPFLIVNPDCCLQDKLFMNM